MKNLHFVIIAFLALAPNNTRAGMVALDGSPSLLLTPLASTVLKACGSETTLGEDVIATGNHVTREVFHQLHASCITETRRKGIALEMEFQKACNAAAGGFRQSTYAVDGSLIEEANCVDPRSDLRHLLDAVGK